MKRLPMLVVLCILVTATTAAQVRPNLSGKWMGPSRSDATALTIDQRATSITIESPTLQSGVVRWTYKLDGSESSNTVAQDGGAVEQTSRAAWDGNTLVISTPGRPNAQGPTVIRQSYSLYGSTLTVTIAVTQGETGAVLQNYKTTYSK